jgi:hypothetical protein
MVYVSRGRIRITFFDHSDLMFTDSSDSHKVFVGTKVLTKPRMENLLVFLWLFLLIMITTPSHGNDTLAPSGGLGFTSKDSPSPILQTPPEVNKTITLFLCAPERSPNPRILHEGF